MGVVSRRWMWVESMGVASGCGCKEVYRFPHISHPYSACICSFLQQHPNFLFIFFNRTCIIMTSPEICLPTLRPFLKQRYASHWKLCKRLLAKCVSSDGTGTNNCRAAK